MFICFSSIFESEKLFWINVIDIVLLMGMTYRAWSRYVVKCRTAAMIIATVITIFYSQTISI
jgi:hypothetical protein